MYPWKIHPHILIYITYIQYSSLLFYLLLRLQSPIDSFEVLLLLLLLILLLLFPRLYPPTFSAIWPTQTFIFHSGFLKSHMRSSFMKTTNIHPLPNIKRVDSQSIHALITYPFLWTTQAPPLCTSTSSTPILQCQIHIQIMHVILSSNLYPTFPDGS